jgi:hypothetical protein
MADRIIQCFGPQSKETVTSLRKQGWGYGEIVKALYLAQKSGKGVNEIVGMKASGMGWGQIVQKLGLPPSELGKAERSCAPGKGSGK